MDVLNRSADPVNLKCTLFIACGCGCLEIRFERPDDLLQDREGVGQDKSGKVFKLLLPPCFASFQRSYGVPGLTDKPVDDRVPFNSVTAIQYRGNLRAVSMGQTEVFVTLAQDLKTGIKVIGGGLQHIQVMIRGGEPVRWAIRLPCVQNDRQETNPL